MTVRVKVAVAVDEDGGWYAIGVNDSDDECIKTEAAGQVGDNRLLYWLQADLELPLPARRARIVNAKVSKA